MFLQGLSMSRCLPLQPDCAGAWLAAAGFVDDQAGHEVRNIMFDVADPALGSPVNSDARSIVYADEGDPLDRTILALDDLRKPVLVETGGSMLVLSPFGSKVMALGALMAALERDLTVAYLESIGYELESSIPKEIDEPNLVNLWLEGDVYPQLRPELSTEGSVV